MSPPVPSSRCVVLVPSGRVFDSGCEAALAELSRRGCPVWRIRDEEPAPGVRDKMAADALAAGFDELLWVSPEVVFDADDAERLRSHGLPLVCGLYPKPAAREFDCEFLPDSTAIRFGRGGGLLEVESAGCGFVLIRRAVFDAIRAKFGPEEPLLDTDAAFCGRVRTCGLTVMADTSIRLYRVGPHRYGWEDTGGDRDRTDSFLFHPHPVPADPPDDVHPEPARNPLRGRATPLPSSFPSVRAFTFSYAANLDSLDLTLASFRASDWGEEPVVLMQPADWPRSRESGSRNYQRVLDAAAADGCDFALIFEDDVRVNRHLRHNLHTNPLVARDQCDYLGLFMPDLVADPWERAEPHLGYRLAKPRYSGPNHRWERSRGWGSQGYLLSRRLVLACLERWDRLGEGQDTRVLGTCGELGLPLWYTLPCLVEHAPPTSAFGTPAAYAPDFDPDFRLVIGAGFQPPEDVPGWLTLPEAGLLFRIADGLDVLELGTASGRSAVCLGQSARRVVSVDVADQAEAAEWVQRYGLSERVEFRRGDAGEVCRGLSGRFGLVFIDTLHDAASVERDIAAALPLLEADGLLAFHDYPDPGWPDVRRVVDDYARRDGWRRVGQVGFLGCFGRDGWCRGRYRCSTRW